MYTGEDGGVGRVLPDIGRGVLQAPAVRICRTSEVTPTKVGIVQRVTMGIGDAFGPVEGEIATAFLPELGERVAEVRCIQEKMEGWEESVRTLAGVAL